MSAVSEVIFPIVVTPQITAPGATSLALQTDGTAGDYVTANAPVIELSTATNPRFEIGSGTRTGPIFAQEASTGGYFTNSLIGDLAIRNTTGQVLIGSGTGTPQITLNGASNISLNVTSNDNTQNSLLALNGSNLLVTRAATSVLNNPFNQSLNTTNSPTFAGLSLTSVANDNTQVDLLAVNGSNVIVYRTATSILNNPFNQTLNTNSSPSFAGVTTPSVTGNSTNLTLSAGTVSAYIACSESVLVSASAIGPRFEIGSGTEAGPIFAQATSSNQYFTGTASGDLAIRNSTVGKVFLGTGSGTPQIGLSGTTAVTINGGNTTLNSLTNTNSATEILALNGSSVVVYRNIPATPCTLTAVYQLASTQTIANGSNVSVNFPAGQISNSIGFTYTSNTFNVPIAGLYIISWNITWDSAVSNTQKQTWLTTTGSDLWGYVSANDPSSSNGQVQSSFTSLTLTTSQSFQIIVLQNSGSSITILGSSPSACRLNVVLLQSF